MHSTKSNIASRDLVRFLPEPMLLAWENISRQRQPHGRSSLCSQCLEYSNIITHTIAYHSDVYSDRFRNSNGEQTWSHHIDPIKSMPNAHKVCDRVGFSNFSSALLPKWTRLFFPFDPTKEFSSNDFAIISRNTPYINFVFILISLLYTRSQMLPMFPLSFHG